MRNLGLLNKKCSGWKPIDTVAYLRKCTNASHAEAEFVNLLCNAMKMINEQAKSKRVFLYNLPASSWDSDTQSAFVDAPVIFAGNFGSGISVTMRQFHPEPDYVYFHVVAEQDGEKIELLFLEKLK